MQAKPIVSEAARKQILEEVARRLNMVATKIKSGKRLSVRSAFFKWAVLSNTRIIPHALQTLLRNSRLTPSKAIHALFSRPVMQQLDLSVAKIFKSRLQCLNQLCQVVKRVQHRHKLHFFYHSRLHHLKTPLLYMMQRRLLKKKYVQPFRCLREHSRRVRDLKFSQTMQKLEGSLIPGRGVDPRLRAFWNVKVEAVRNGKRSKGVTFADDDDQYLQLNLGKSRTLKFFKTRQWR